MTSQILNGCFGASRALAGRGLCSSLLVLLALGAVPAGAATINANGSTCSLQNAIRAANRNGLDPQVPPANSCTNGSNLPSVTDIINLSYDVDVNNAAGSNAGLPEITSPITLNGNQHTIQRTGSNNFRLLYVSISGSLTINNVTIKNGKEPTLDGGAIYNVGALTINNSIFDSNQCTLDGCRGGAIRNSNILVIDNSTFTNNTSNGSYGGAIYNTLNISSLARSTFSNNISSNSLGGAIYNDGGYIALSSSTFNANSGPQGGGAIANSAGVLDIINCTFNGNSSLQGGGALYNFGNGLLTLSLSTFIGNIANEGGAIHIASATTNGITMQGNLISGNTANTSASEIYHDGTASITNSYNLLGDNGTTYSQSLFNYVLGTGDINANQTLPNGDTNPASTALASILNTTLGYNGGPTQTHALVGGSPAIDVVDSALCFPGDPDQRGYYRANGNANEVTDISYPDLPDGNTKPPQTGYGNIKCDIGAYEFAAKPVNIGDGKVSATASRFSGPTSDGNGRYTIQYHTYWINNSSGPLHNVIFKLNTICFLDKPTNPTLCKAGTEGYLVDGGGTTHGPGWAVAISNSSFGGTWDNGEQLPDQDFKLSISTNKGTLRFWLDQYADPAGREPLAASGNREPKLTGQLVFDVDLDGTAIPETADGGDIQSFVRKLH